MAENGTIHQRDTVKKLFTVPPEFADHDPEQQTQPTWHRVQKSYPSGSHWWETSALNTAPSMHAPPKLLLYIELLRRNKV